MQNMLTLIYIYLEWEKYTFICYNLISHFFVENGSPYFKIMLYFCVAINLLKLKRVTYRVCHGIKSISGWLKVINIKF